jgi:hypothetical protein
MAPASAVLTFVCALAQVKLKRNIIRQAPVFNLMIVMPIISLCISCLALGDYTH